MRAALLLSCCLIVVADDSFAHRLDEYLQATRISITTNRIDLTFELTPGVAIAAQVLELIDSDRDGLGDLCDACRSSHFRRRVR